MSHAPAKLPQTTQPQLSLSQATVRDISVPQLAPAPPVEDRDAFTMHYAELVRQFNGLLRDHQVVLTKLNNMTVGAGPGYTVGFPPL